MSQQPIKTNQNRETPKLGNPRLIYYKFIIFPQSFREPRNDGLLPGIGRVISAGVVVE
jgi:hypothetical protein